METALARKTCPGEIDPFAAAAHLPSPREREGIGALAVDPGKHRQLTWCTTASTNYRSVPGDCRGGDTFGLARVV